MGRLLQTFALMFCLWLPDTGEAQVRVAVTPFESADGRLAR